MSFKTTANAALDALKTKLESLEYGGETMFDDVTKTTLVHILEALDHFRKFEGNICLLVWADTDFEAEQDGSHLQISQILKVRLLMSCRDVLLQTTLFSALIPMASQVVTDIAGETLSLDHIPVIPTGFSPVRVALDADDLPSAREGVQLDFDIPLGRHIASLGPGTRI